MSRRFAIALFAAAVMCVGYATSLIAQVDPRGRVRTIPTAHFRVHYRSNGGIDSANIPDALARRAADIAERAYAALAEDLVAPHGVIDLLLADNVDFSNGFAQVFPSNRVVVYLTPPIAAIELREQDEWLELVISHELAHIFHIDRARGLWAVGRSVFGRNPLFFPNGLLPSWVKEGLAQFYETKLTGNGRIYARQTYAPLYAAALDSTVPPISRWSLATSRYPRGTTAYAYGAAMMRTAVEAGDSVAMRRFVEETAQHPVPFRLNRASRIAFGASFDSLYTRLDFTERDLRNAVVDRRRDRELDAQWNVISSAGMYADSPRWISNDSVMWSASNGREVTGVYVADVNGTGRPRRVARRNALDANVPMGGDSVLFAQSELENPYVQRSDLWIGRGSHERRLTYGARLVQPDARGDGAIVAVQIVPTRTQLVRVDAAGGVTVIASGEHGENWAEPRWSHDGRYVVAIQLLRDGYQRVVVTDTVGRIVDIVAAQRAVLANPSFSPDSRRVVWASNASGAMRVETARVELPLLERAGVGATTGNANASTIDTTRSANTPSRARVAASASAGAYDPSVSPDGKRVVALLLRSDGYHVAVAMFDTAVVESRTVEWTRVGVVSEVGADPGLASRQSAAASSRPFNPIPQLLPRYWLPIVGVGRLNESTYGFASSSEDILGRHAWSADAAVNPRRGEVDGTIAYRYAGLGVPVLDLAWSQAWDATFTVADDKRNVLGTIARRRQFATASATFLRPRVRTSVSATVGMQYELRDFTATTDSLLGAQGSLLRRGTRYPQLFASTGVSTLRRGIQAIAYEEGVTLSATSAYRWREDAPSVGSWRGVLSGRVYVPIDLPGFSRHVLSMRAAGGWTDTRTATEFSVGGISGVSTTLIPGVSVGDPSRTFPLRGVPAVSQVGIRALGGGVEYRVPLRMFRDAPSPLTFYADRVSLTLFSDVARAWCPGSFAAQSASIGLCERSGTRDGWIATAGAELVLDAALQYDVPYRFRLGGGLPYVSPQGISRRGTVYVSLGSFF